MSAGRVDGWLVIGPDNTAILGEFDTAHVFTDRRDAIGKARSEGGRPVPVEIVKSQTSSTPRRGRRPKDPE